MLVGWVEGALGKRIAEDKKQCIATTKALRVALKPAVANMGFHISAEGDLLGIDYGAGGRLQTRRIMKGIKKKATGRRGRLRWWRRAGGTRKKWCGAASFPASLMPPRLPGSLPEHCAPSAAYKEPRRGYQRAARPERRSWQSVGMITRMLTQGSMTQHHR